MKASPRTTRRSTESHDYDCDHLVIQLPDPRVLRVIARSVLFAATILSFPWLRTIFISSVVAATVEPKWVDDPFFLRMLIRDLKREGLFNSDGRAVFLGNPSSRLPFLKKNQIDPVSDYRKLTVDDNSVDFVLTADGLKDSSFSSFINRVLKVGGVIAVRLRSDPSESFHLPSNYRIAYIRRFGSTVVAIKKISNANADDFKGVRKGRRLLSVSKSKKEALKGLEDALLEPPTVKEKHRKRIRYLPDLMGDDSLDGYPRRVFVDLGPAGRMGNLEWFERNYPKKNREFELIRVDLVAGEEGGGMAEWLQRNVRGEDYVVMKAEAEVVEEMLKERVIGLVDELFMECKNQWDKGKKSSSSKRAYWECLALYGRVRDEGIAVHQWWD